MADKDFEAAVEAGKAAITYDPAHADHALIAEVAREVVQAAAPHLLKAERSRMLSPEALRTAAKVNHPLWSAYEPQVRRRLTDEVKRSIEAALEQSEED
jgi:LmbE family N-acetylglucosaminyl deacetylase